MANSLTICFFDLLLPLLLGVVDIPLDPMLLLPPRGVRTEGDPPRGVSLPLARGVKRGMLDVRLIYTRECSRERKIIKIEDISFVTGEGGKNNRKR